jgi:hypothetical protein
LGEPISNVEIFVDGKYMANSQSDGYFILAIELQDIQSEVNLEFFKEGILKYQISNLLVWKHGDWILKPTIDVNSDKVILENTDKSASSASLGGQQGQKRDKTETQRGVQTFDALCDIEMITVGFNGAYASDCCVWGTNSGCSNCSYYDIIPIDEYVKHVLPAEWLAGNWQNLSGIQHSYRAGAVAIKTYGAFLVLNPLCTNFDVCDGPCCQGFASFTNSMMNDAVNFVTGSYLWDTPNNEEALAQYSSENNNLGEIIVVMVWLFQMDVEMDTLAEV